MAKTVQGRLILEKDKAAALMLCLSPEKIKKIFSHLTEEEIRKVCLSMTNIGVLEPSTIEMVVDDFITLADKGVVWGTHENTKKLLATVLSAEKIESIFSGMDGPSSGVWDYLSTVEEEVLLNFLKTEHPQAVAVIVSRLKTDYAARILSLFPQELSLDIITRMLTTNYVKRDVLDELEKSLKKQLMPNITQGTRSNPYETVAEIFNAFDRNTEKKMLEALEKKNAEEAQKVKDLMFTFSDLVRVDKKGMQALIRSCDKNLLGLALKGADEKISSLFFDNMSSRAVGLMKEDMEALGPVPVRDVDDAQTKIVSLVKLLSDEGELSILDHAFDDEMIT